jgi:hypothetical protein
LDIRSKKSRVVFFVGFVGVVIGLNNSPFSLIETLPFISAVANVSVLDIRSKNELVVFLSVRIFLGSRSIFPFISAVANVSVLDIRSKNAALVFAELELGVDGLLLLELLLPLPLLYPLLLPLDPMEDLEILPFISAVAYVSALDIRSKNPSVVVVFFPIGLCSCLVFLLFLPVDLFLLFISDVANVSVLDMRSKKAFVVFFLLLEVPVLVLVFVLELIPLPGREVDVVLFLLGLEEIDADADDEDDNPEILPFISDVA